MSDNGGAFLTLACVCAFAGIVSGTTWLLPVAGLSLFVGAIMLLGE